MIAILDRLSWLALFLLFVGLVVVVEIVDAALARRWRR